MSNSRMPVRALMSTEIEDTIKKLTEQAIEKRDCEIRQRTLDKGAFPGAKCSLPLGTVLVRQYEVVKCCRTTSEHTTSNYVYICSGKNTFIATKLAKDKGKNSKDFTFCNVYRELLVWKELEKFLPMPYFNPPLIDQKLDPRALSFRALSFNFEQLMDKFAVLPIGLCLLTAADTLCAIKLLHDCGFVHRNIHPRHFCLGLKEGDTKTSIVYLIDLSHAERFVCFDPDAEVPQINFEPDPLYSSTFVLDGKQHTRRDDLLSWIYTLMAMRNCNFWRKYTGDQFAKVKDELEEDKLVVGYGPTVGPVMAAMLCYLRQLTPYHKPDYHFLMQCVVTGLKTFCDNNCPPSLPDNFLDFWKLHKFQSTVKEEAFAPRYKIIARESCFAYLDENPEKVNLISMQSRINKWFDAMKKDAHLKMFKIIEARMKTPEEFPSFLDKSTSVKRKKTRQDEQKSEEENKMLPARTTGKLKICFFRVV